MGKEGLVGRNTIAVNEMSTLLLFDYLQYYYNRWLKDGDADYVYVSAQVSSVLRDRGFSNIIPISKDELNKSLARRVAVNPVHCYESFPEKFPLEGHFDCWTLAAHMLPFEVCPKRLQSVASLVLHGYPAGNPTLETLETLESLETPGIDSCLLERVRTRREVSQSCSVF
ncbi:MAG: hypothetical protein ACOCXP_00175 [Candidatus Dojkabacteria bacterium]